MKKITPKVVVGGLVLLDGKILIIQRSNSDDTFPGLWEIPSGGKKELEPAKAAVIREVYEETGVDVEVDRLVDVFNFQVEKADEIRDSTQISFLVNPVGVIEIRLSDEHQNYAWISSNDLNNYNLSDETKETLNKAFRLFENGPI